MGGIWIDARYERKGIPFCEQPNVQGFPRLVDYKKPAEIDLTDGQSILYRKETNLDRATSEPKYWPLPFRIRNDGLEEELEVTIADCEL
jgi:hypothetical protein